MSSKTDKANKTVEEREQELVLIEEYIKKNGVTKLPKDARIDGNPISAWTCRPKKANKTKKRFN